MSRLSILSAVAAWAVLATASLAAPAKFPAYTDAAEAGYDYTVQGEYAGTLALPDGSTPYGVQVIAVGDGQFRAVFHKGGLPGAGWDKSAKEEAASDGQSKGGAKVAFTGPKWKCDVEPARGVLAVRNSGGDTLGELKKIERKSPTLGAAPPAGAIILFDGNSLDALQGGQLTADKLLTVGQPPEKPGDAPRRGDILTRQSFGDCTLHVEFRTPFMPSASGQARGNSGVYLQNRYECQILDSFGLSGENNECGGFYQAARPSVNMCLPPLSWQTYDFEFTAPKFDASGNKTANARVTLRHNGVVIHDNLELKGLTPGGEKAEAAAGPLKLQDHGNPVCFRNIWVVEKK